MDKDAAEISMVSGAVSSSAVPYFHLIPLESLRRLALRFFVGTERKKEKAWNAITPNQHVLTDRAFVLDRISHTIYHAYKLRDKIVRNEPFDDDDAGAIAWGGAFLCCVTEAIEAERIKTKPNCSACGGDGSVANPYYGDSHQPDICTKISLTCPACHGTGKSNLK